MRIRRDGAMVMCGMRRSQRRTLQRYCCICAAAFFWCEREASGIGREGSGRAAAAGGQERGQGFGERAL